MAAPVHFEPLEPRYMLSGEASPSAEFTQLLTVGNVSTILKQAGAAAKGTQVVAVVDRENNILGIFELNGAAALPAIKLDPFVEAAISEADTAAAFESTQDAFTTRTAAFIIANHFPPGVLDMAGGPLYGVQNSSLPGSDVLPNQDVPGISGAPGGIPLYKNGVPVGGIGVAGAPGNPNFDEAVALTGATGYMAPAPIRANNIFIDGFRLPFTVASPAQGKTVASLSNLITGPGAVGVLAAAPTFGKATSDVLASPGTAFPIVSFAGVTGQMKNPNPAATNFGFVAGSDASSQNLTLTDVQKIIAAAVHQATTTRAGIRQPIGVEARVYISVVDTDGDVLGVFRIGDATNFSYDVAVQKARTAAFFSDNTHAITTRAIGFLAQGLYPPGIGPAAGPLSTLQGDLSIPANLKAPLANGITIFPGGIPLYKHGVLVGAIGVSGDGVDQDDYIANAGTAGFAPPAAIRSDELSDASIVAFLITKIDSLFPTFLTLAQKQFIVGRLAKGLDGVRLPYVKFPRNPGL